MDRHWIPRQCLVLYRQSRVRAWLNWTNLANSRDGIPSVIFARWEVVIIVVGVITATGALDRERYWSR